MGIPLTKSVEDDITSRQVARKMYPPPALPITVLVEGSGCSTIDGAVESSIAERERIKQFLRDVFKNIPGVTVL